MRFKFVLFLIAILSTLAFLPAPQAEAQIELQKMGLLKKEVWTPWVMNPANNACIQYTYSMGMKEEGGTNICDVGDMVLLNALLCYSGDKKACDYVVASQDSKGKFYRSPMHARAGGKYPGTATEFSRDHMLGVMLYLVSDPDQGRAKKVAQRWQKWLNEEAVLTPEDLMKFADKIKNEAKREATNAANCAARSACWKEATVDVWEDLTNDEKIACGLIFATFPPAGIACPSVIKNGKKLKSTGGPGIFSTFLPHVCEGDESRCVVTPPIFAMMYQVWLSLGLIPDPNMILFQTFDTEQSIVDNVASLHGTDLHLLAIKGLIRQRIGLSSAKIFARINSREPNNPFYMALFNKFNNEELPWSAIGARVLESCPTDVVGKDPKASNVWLWKVKDIDAEKHKTALWDCIFMANFLRVKEYSYLKVVNSVPFTVRVRRNENPSVNQTVAIAVSDGIPPLRYELLSKPTDYSYFAFEAETGNFLFQPVNSYFGGSFRFAVTDATGRRLESSATIAFDRSEIYPGHPPLTQTPPTPLPANIYPSFSITNTETGQVRSLSNDEPSPTELLTVTTGTLAIQAEAFIENVDDAYAGNLDCTLDWTGKDGAANLIKDTDEYPRNFFIQKSIAVASLEPYETRLFRMNCFAPDMPIVVKDIPIVYMPSAVALSKPLDKNEYLYASSNGATLKLTLNKNASTGFNREYSYVLKSVDCGQKTGALTAATNVNKLTIDGSFDGLLVNGDAQKLVWLNAPVCGKAQAIVWKLQATVESGSSGGSSYDCNLTGKGYGIVDAVNKPQTTSFSMDMEKCGKAIKASDWSCGWVTADRTWIVPSLNAVVFAADRWKGTFNIFTFDSVKNQGCKEAPKFLEKEVNPCDMVSKRYKTIDSFKADKPTTFAADMQTCGAKVKPSDWTCPNWVTAEETWVVPALKSVVFTSAKLWGETKYNVFSFSTVMANGCKDPRALVK